MIESLPLLLTGGGVGARIANSIVANIPVSLGDIGALSQNLTIAGTDYAPTAYLVADDINVSTGAWASRHNAAKIASVTGSGSDPTYSRDTAITNKAVQYNAGKRHEAADTTWGQITTGDAALEIVFRGTSDTVALFGARQPTGGLNGIWGYTTTGEIVVQFGIAGTVVSINSTGAAIGSKILHLFLGIDRSDKAYMFLNGVYHAVSAATSGLVGDMTGRPLAVGDYSSGATPYSERVLSLALWNLATNPWPGAATNQAVMGAVASARFAIISGISCVKGCSTSFSRTSAAYSDRYTTASVRTLFPVSSGWPRVCQRLGSSGTAEYGYLSEPQCTNEFLYSEDFSNAAWTKTRATVSSNAAVAPDGTTTADGIVGEASANTHTVGQAMASGATEHLFSVWCKSGAKTWVELSAPSVANAYCYFNLSTAAAGAPGAGCNSVGIQDWGGGWCRCWIAYTGGAPSHDHVISPADADGDDSYTGDGATVDIYVWGAQHEDDGTVIPSSYIKTTTAAATRVADALTYTTATHSTSKVALSARAYLGPSHNNTQAKQIVSVDDASNNNSVGISVTASDVCSTDVVSGGVAQASIAGSGDISDGAWHNVACTAIGTLVRQKVDGATDGTDDTSATIPTGLTTLRVGCSTTSNTGQPLALIRDIVVKKDVI